ncbi:response regulator transcription factor [Micromonospora sp. NPDC051300]|uniref:response regulator transcription factor n=1 Tax=Micromonospora sp. NPDC051300 TaxID=3364286 RepID=UPI0037A592F4
MILRSEHQAEKGVSSSSRGHRSRCHRPPRRACPEIGDELSISLSTVKTHMAALMRKLNARNRVEVVRWAYETRRVGT